MMSLEQAVKALRFGGLVAIPTETVYGLAADATNELAVRRIFAAKGRPSNHPLIVHLSTGREMFSWANSIPESAQKLASTFWPGPLTLVLSNAGRAAPAVTGGQNTIALRVPNHPLTLRLLTLLQTGVAAPSANLFGKLSPTRAVDVELELGHAIDGVLDGGPCAIGVESTIVDCVSKTPRILRVGGLPKEKIEEVLGFEVEVASDIKAAGIQAPGMLESHYAPTAGLIIVEKEVTIENVLGPLLDLGRRIAVWSPVQPAIQSNQIIWKVLPANENEHSQQLYSTLREFDHAGVDVIVTTLPNRSGMGLAIRDRLQRASVKKT